MNLLRAVLTIASLALASCVRQGPAYVITDVIPAGSSIEYFAQIHDESWQSTMKMKSIPRPMPVRVAEKWALSAAQQRLGNHWKDYRFRVTTPNGPVIVWQRRGNTTL